MKSLFNPTTYEEVKDRLAKLPPTAKALWGKMTVAQMLAHCAKAVCIPLSDTQPPRWYPFALIGWLFKEKLYNDDPWKRNLPTPPTFIIRDERDFEKERSSLLELLTRFHTAGPDRAAGIKHPVFGRFTGEQWGKADYKHLDHHLSQFGV